MICRMAAIGMAGRHACRAPNLARLGEFRAAGMPPRSRFGAIYCCHTFCQIGARRMTKLKKTFRLEEESYEELVKLSEEWDVSQGAAVERAIRFVRQIPGDCQTVDSGVLDVLSGQLAVKDEQIAALNRALDAAHETAKAAQVLHAQERKALESVEQKGRWQRLKDAWRGDEWR